MYVLSLIINLVTIARIPIVWCCRFLFFSLLYIFRVHIFLVLCRLCLAYVFTVQCFKSFRYKCAIATSICWVLLTLNKKQQQQKTQKQKSLERSTTQHESFYFRIYVHRAQKLCCKTLILWFKYSSACEFVRVLIWKYMMASHCTIVTPLAQVASANWVGVLIKVEKSIWLKNMKNAVWGLVD